MCALTYIPIISPLHLCCNAHRRRPTKTGRTSLFSGLVYCPDCGAKLHFSAAKSMTRNQEHFRCANYKSGRGNCTVHYIRDVVLERIVLEAISDLADFVRCYEPVFLYMLAKKNSAMRQKKYRRIQQAVDLRLILRNLREMTDVAM